MFVLDVLPPGRGVALLRRKRSSEKLIPADAAPSLLSAPLQVNANIGNSAVVSSIEEEVAKVQWATRRVPPPPPPAAADLEPHKCFLHPGRRAATPRMLCCQKQQASK